jgi:hypothetical protein
MRIPAVQDVHKGDRRFGWFGYEGFIMQTDYDATTTYFETAPDYNTLITNRDNLAAATYNSGSWVADTNSGWNARGWKALGNLVTQFRKIFDGQGFAATGLWINRPDAGPGNPQGLFSTISFGAILENLGVNTDEKGVSGTASVGALAGKAAGNAIIRNCFTTGKVTGNSAEVGGMAGAAETATISSCYSTCSVNGQRMVGGLIGYASFGTNINNCYATGMVTGNQSVGGLTGLTQGDDFDDFYGTVISNSYATGAVQVTGSSPRHIGGLVGYVTSRYDEVSNCFAFNAGITINGSTQNVGRVAGNRHSGATLQNNYALDNLPITGGVFTLSTNLLNNQNGANISARAAITNANPYTTNGWSFPGVWIFDYTNYRITDATNLPILSIFTKAAFSNAIQPPTVENRNTCQFELLSTSATREVCVNTHMEDIVYAVSDEITEVTSTGLPPGISITIDEGVLTVSGIPRVSGEFEYTLTPEGDCSGESVTGTITVLGVHPPKLKKNRVP